MTWPYGLSWLTLLLPLLGGLFSFIAETPRRAAQICAGFTVLAFLMSLVVLGFRVYHHQESGAAYDNLITFFNLTSSDATVFPNGIQTQIGVHVDNLSTLFAALITSVGAAAQLHATSVLRGDSGYRRFFWVASLLIGGLLAVDFSAGLLQTWLGAGMVSGATLMLALHWWQREGAGDAARRGWLTLLAADCGLLFALVFDLTKYGAALTSSGQSPADSSGYSLLEGFWASTRAGTIANAGTRTLTVLSLLVIAVLLARAAQIPFTGWLSGLREAPLPALGLLGGGALLTGPLIAARFYPLFLDTPHMLTVLGLVAAGSAAVLAAAALLSNDIYRIGLLLAAAQIGVALAAMGAGGYSDGLFAAFVAAPAALLLFVVAGNLVRVYRTRLVTEMGGAFSRVRRTALGLVVWAVAVSGADLGAYHAMAAALRDQTPAASVHLAVGARVVLAILVISALVLIALCAARVFFVVAAGDPVRRRGFDVQRMAEVEPRLRRVVGLGVAATLLTALCGIPGLNSFSSGSTHVAGLTFSHWVYFGGIRQQLSVNGYALVASAVILGGALVAGATVLARVDLGAAGAALGHVPWRRVVAPVAAVAATGGGILEATDNAVLAPLLDAPVEGIAAAATLTQRVRSSRIGVAAAATVLVIVAVATLSALAAAGHLPVHTR